MNVWWLVGQLVADIGEAIAEDGQQRRTARQPRVDVQQLTVVPAREDVEVNRAARRRADDRVPIRLPDVDRVAPRRVHQEAPPLRRDRHRNRDVARDVLDVDLVAARPPLEVRPAHVAEAVDALVRLQRQRDPVALADLLDLHGRARQLDRARRDRAHGRRLVGRQDAVAVHAAAGRPRLAYARQVRRQRLDLQLHRRRNRRDKRQGQRDKQDFQDCRESGGPEPTFFSYASHAAQYSRFGHTFLMLMANILAKKGRRREVEIGQEGPAARRGCGRSSRRSTCGARTADPSNRRRVP